MNLLIVEDEIEIIQGILAIVCWEDIGMDSVIYDT